MSKSRRPFVHVLFALLLLFTQQIGATHIYTHWLAQENGTRQQAERDSDAVHLKQLETHKNCSQCVALAQIAAAIHSPAVVFAAGELAVHAVAVPPVLAACERTTCVFQPRAPPLA